MKRAPTQEQQAPCIGATAQIGGEKFDDGKLRFDLVPADSLEDVVRVFTYGSEKYGDRNWEKGLLWGRLFAAVQRHLWCWWRGQDVDDESGLPHLAHAACSLLMLLDYKRSRAGSDDRPTSS